MKSLKKKMALIIIQPLLLMMLIFFGSLSGLDYVSAQGGGQVNQTSGLGGLGSLGYLGGLGAGYMMGVPGFNMIGTGLGMVGLGSSGIASPLGAGLSMGGSGSLGMLGISPLITGGISMPGLGSSNPYNMFSSPFSLGGGFSPYYGQFMPVMGMGYMYPGMPPITPFSNFYNTSFPMGYNTYYISSLVNSVASRYSNSTGISGVPYFVTASGQIILSPLPSWPYTQFPQYQASILPINVVGYVYDADEPNLPLEGVVVSVLVNNTSVYDSDPTDFMGRYVLELFSGQYIFSYHKEGYEDQTKNNVLVNSNMGMVSSVYMEKIIQPLNKAPEFISNMLSLEVIAGDTILLDPNDYAYDPDNNPLTFSYSGWNESYWEAGSPYITTDDDIGIGIHKVEITASDQEFFVTQTLVINIYPGYDMTLYVGFNLISYPFEYEDPNFEDPDFTAVDLLERLGGFPQISSIKYYDSISDKYITLKYDQNGELQGTNFPIKTGQGYVIYANEDIEKTVFNRYTGKTQYLDLYEGMNLIGIASYPEGYTSYDLLLELGHDNVDSIYRYNPFWGDWESTYWLNGSPSGDVFPILMGEGYQIQMKMQSNLTLPRLRYFTF